MAAPNDVVQADLDMTDSNSVNGTREIGPSYAKSVIYIRHIPVLDIHGTGTKHIVRHRLKSVVQWFVISKFACILKYSW